MPWRGGGGYDWGKLQIGGVEWLSGGGAPPLPAGTLPCTPAGHTSNWPSPSVGSVGCRTGRRHSPSGPTCPERRNAPHGWDRWGCFARAPPAPPPAEGACRGGGPPHASARPSRSRSRGSFSECGRAPLYGWTQLGGPAPEESRQGVPQRVALQAWHPLEERFQWRMRCTSARAVWRGRVDRDRVWASVADFMASISPCVRPLGRLTGDPGFAVHVLRVGCLRSALKVFFYSIDSRDAPWRPRCVTVFPTEPTRRGSEVPLTEPTRRGSEVPLRRKLCHCVPDRADAAGERGAPAAEVVPLCSRQSRRGGG
eukprot:gene1788-biopygen22886